MHNLKQELGIKNYELKLVTYVTYNKTSNRMMIYSMKYKRSPYTILYQ